MSATAFKQLKNNAISTTSTTLTSTGVTSIIVATGDGSKFPTPGNGFWMTLWNGTDPTLDPNMEIVLCSARSSDTLTVAATTQTHTNPCNVALLDVTANMTDLQTSVNNLENGTNLFAATTGAIGAVQLASDLAGTATSPQVTSTHLSAALPVTQGGTGTSSALTAGSIVFAGSSGTYSQNNADLFWDNTNNRLGIMTAVPTHTLTHGSTSTGATFYNTSDQTTNYERITMSWATNIFSIRTAAGGTGGVRNLVLGTANRSLTFVDASSTSGFFQFNVGSGNSTSYTGLVFVGTSAVSSGTFIAQSIAPTINQTSTSGYTALLVNPTETAVGSGNNLLIDLQAGGTSKFRVDNKGKITVPTGGAAAVAGTGTLSSGTVTISTTVVTASSLIFLADTSNGANIGTLSVGTKTAGTSFVVNSSNVLDASTFNWIIIN